LLCDRQPSTQVMCGLFNSSIYGHAAHGPAARPATRPFGTAHGPHGTALTVLVPARHEGQCVSWAAGQAHYTARARHGQGRGTVAGTAPAPHSYRHGSCSGGRPSALWRPLLLVPSLRQEPRMPAHLLLVGTWQSSTRPPAHGRAPPQAGEPSTSSSPPKLSRRTGTVVSH
jgi:hypothetical protein